MSADAEFVQTLDTLETEIPALDLALSIARLEDRLAGLAIGTLDQSQVAELAMDETADHGFAAIGTAEANAVDSFDDALAYGVLAGADLSRFGPHAVLTSGSDILSGEGTATGTGKAESRGVSFGTEDSSVGNPEDDDDGGDAGGEDEEDFGPSPEDFIANLTVTARFGKGDDVVDGTATTFVDATDPNGEGFELIFAGANGVIIDFDSTVSMGRGDDTLSGSASVTSRSNPVTDNGQDGASGGDADLEIIADGVENVGELSFGMGDDTLMGVAQGDAIGGATAIADGIDSSSVGNENVANAVIRMGQGDDTIFGRGQSRSEGDGALANGFDNRATTRLGQGDDVIDVAANAEFVDDPTDGDQEEAIADGIENRGTILFGSGDDLLIAEATATGNGVLTIADGIDSRGNPDINRFDGDRGISLRLGRGDDRVEARGTAIQTPDLADGTVNQDNQRTVASGMLNQNVTSPAVLFGSGDDEVEVTGIARGDDNPTFAAGMSNISFDLPNAGADGILGTADDIATFIDFASGNDVVIATAEGSVTDTGPDSAGDVAAFGYWGGLTDLGGGNNRLEGSAKITAAVNALAIGISVDDDMDLINGARNEMLETQQGAMIRGGGGEDHITGFAEISGATGDDVRAIGLFLGADGFVSTRGGADIIEGDAIVDGEGEAFGIFGEEGAIIDTGSGEDLVSAGAAGFGGGFLLDTGGGDDRIEGFGSVVVNAGRGDDTLDLTGFGTAESFQIVDEDGDGLVDALIQDGVTMTLNGTVETILFDEQIL